MLFLITLVQGGSCFICFNLDKILGIRNSFGTSSPPLQTTDAVSTVQPPLDSPVQSENSTEKVQAKKSTTARNRCGKSTHKFTKRLLLFLSKV